MIAVLLGGIALVVLGGVLALFVSLTVGVTAWPRSSSGRARA